MKKFEYYMSLKEVKDRGHKLKFRLNIIFNPFTKKYKIDFFKICKFCNFREEQIRQNRGLCRICGSAVKVIKNAEWWDKNWNKNEKI